MAVIYPKRSYAAPLDATSLDWQRAAVIVFHDQPGSLPAGLPRPARAAQAGAKRVQGFGAVFAIVLLAVLAWAIQHRQSEQAADAAVSWGSQSADGPGAALAAAMLNMSEADASLLRSLPRRLGDACERNKDALGQQACRALLYERGGSCLAPVARRYSGQAGNTDHMAMIINAYLHCVFDE